jgi:hypothetical protein
MTPTKLTEDPLTFTKLFAERKGATFAHVLRQCLTTPDLLESFNRAKSTRLVWEPPSRQHPSGRLVYLEEGMKPERQLNLFAQFAWREVFLRM